MSSDPNLDDLKRRARRRLVGAVVLALAAAVFVPMLLESEQKPLGDDVAVRIPPVDDGKFVNQLNAPGKAVPAAVPTPAVAAPAPAPAKADSPTTGSDIPSPATAAPAPAMPAHPAAAAPAKSLAEAEQRVMGAKPTPAPAKTTPAPSKAPAAAEPKATPAPTVATAPNVATTPTAPTKAASSGGFIVQLAAFSDDKGANSLSNRLKKAGYPAYIEPVTTTHGTLWRVRVGPFSSRDDANSAHDKLKRDGFNGLVAANPRAP